ncbi:MAG: hypothetical protein EOO07_06040 [Chitinophagaceae bacterium]|nr:MAG: hypothetical protein EOO07_06040 [Chitinophagaceae bacterium]
MLIGKTAAEVESLLGPKENTYKADYWQYYIGWFPGPAIDPALLLIFFKDGKVVKVTLGDS